jgi:hypothetical protein
VEIFEALVTYLKADAGLSAIVGDGVYHAFLPPERKQEAICYQLISLPQGYHLTGTEALAEPVYQFAAYADTNKKAYAAFKALAVAFEKNPSKMGDYTIQHIRQDSGLVYDYEPETHRHAYKADFCIAYTT